MKTIGRCTNKKQHRTSSAQPSRDGVQVEIQILMTCPNEFPVGEGTNASFCGNLSKRPAYEPSVRAPARLNRAGSGTLSRVIWRFKRGDVNVTSTRDAGTVFTFEFPG